MLINTRFELVKEINAAKYKTGVEVGVREGYFSYYLLKHSKLKQLHSVDPWAGRHGEQDYQNAKSMLKHFGNRSTLVREASNQVYNRFKGVDFVYIDANHRYKYVREDIALWWSVLAPGGMLSGHDYVDAKGCGVITAVDEFVAREGLELRVTDEHLATWYVTKPK